MILLYFLIKSVTPSKNMKMVNFINVMSEDDGDILSIWSDRYYDAVPRYGTVQNYASSDIHNISITVQKSHFQENRRALILFEKNGLHKENTLVRFFLSTLYGSPLAYSLIIVFCPQAPGDLSDLISSLP